MSRLIKANFSRLFKSIFFRVCLIFSAGLGIFLDIMRYIDIQRNQEIYDELGIEYKSADGFVFSGILYIIFAIAPFVAVFVGTEYSDGTIRNKLMVGHKRTEIYFANFIVCAAADIIILMSFIVACLVGGLILLRATSLMATQIIIFTLSQCVTMIGFSALLVLLAMLIQNKAGSAVTVLIMTIIMFFATMTIADRLRQPEYYEDYRETIVNEETGEMTVIPENVKNPRYLSGTKREIYEFLNKFLPINQFYQVAVENDENINIMALYSVIIIILANGAGVVLFRRKDLK
ncbi:MAG: ABC transporter permease [Ruminococcus sp.]|nr:ABC transporter permease [Ruminococcus sp.]